MNSSNSRCSDEMLSLTTMIPQTDAEAAATFEPLKQQGMAPTMKPHMLLLAARARSGNVARWKEVMVQLHKSGLARETFALKAMLNSYGAPAASTRWAALAAMDRRETCDMGSEHVGTSGVPGEDGGGVRVAGRQGAHCRRGDVDVLHEHAHQEGVPEVLGHRPLGDVHSTCKNWTVFEVAIELNHISMLLAPYMNLVLAVFPCFPYNRLCRSYYIKLRKYSLLS